LIFHYFLTGNLKLSHKLSPSHWHNSLCFYYNNQTGFDDTNILIDDVQDDLNVDSLIEDFLSIS